MEIMGYLQDLHEALNEKSRTATDRLYAEE